mmetsp:Transcript_32868/g.102628  ORF Transcript_32868/g.102628 Transcript_32868/m.102628 type:complete len:262 (-) Transcript_32868:154-939(-)
MELEAGPSAWGRGSRGLRPRPPPPSSGSPSSSSSTSARAAGPSGPSSTSTGTAPFSRRLPGSCAASAAPPSWSSRLGRWTTGAHPARGGRRRGCLAGRSRSTCTTSPSSAATAASGVRCRLAGSWTSPAARAGLIGWSCATCGRRRATRSGLTAERARTTIAPSSGCRGRRVPSRRRTWSTPAITASGASPLVQKNCFVLMVLHAAPCAVGWGIPKPFQRDLATGLRLIRRPLRKPTRRLESVVRALAQAPGGGQLGSLMG